MAYIIEKMLAAQNIDAYVQHGVATVNLDAGTFVSLSNYKDGLWEITPIDSSSYPTTPVYMVLPSSEQLTPVALNTRTEKFAGLSIDPRAYTNLAGRPVDVIRVVVGDLLSVDINTLANTTAPTVNGELALTGTAGKLASGTLVADQIGFRCVAIETVPFPQAGVGHENVTMYVLECVQ